jgi:hypothetical protein
MKVELSESNYSQMQLRQLDITANSTTAMLKCNRISCLPRSTLGYILIPSDHQADMES